MAEIMTLPQKVQTVRSLFERYKGDIAALIPKHLTPDRFLQIAVTAIRRNPKLADCTPASLLGCVMEAASMGLEVGGLPPEAHLVPFRNSKTGQSDCTLIPDYRGVMKLARQSNEVSLIETHVVYEKDAFSYAYGLDRHLKHEPYRGEDAGPMVAAYCIVRLRDGGNLFEVMEKHKIEARRKRSRAGTEGPWVTDPEPMWRKSTVKCLAPYMPTNRQFQRAVALDDRAELGLPQEIDLLSDTPVVDPPPPTTLDKAVAQLTADGKDKAPAPSIHEAPIGPPPESLLPSEMPADPRDVVDQAIRTARQRGIKDREMLAYLHETMATKNPYSLDATGAQVFRAWAGTAEIGR